MATVSQTPKIDVALPLNETVLRLLGIAASIVALVLIIVAGTSAVPAARPFDTNGYMLYRQGEWVSVPITISNAEGYRIFRLGEVVSPLTPAEAYQLFRDGEVTSPIIMTNGEAYFLYRKGEWVSIPAPAVDLTAYFESERTLTGAQTDLAAYHESERTLIGSQTDMAAYHLSERTLVDPATDMTAYLNSERVLVPVRNLDQFNTYQRSEWFGE